MKLEGSKFSLAYRLKQLKQLGGYTTVIEIMEIMLNKNTTDIDLAKELPRLVALIGSEKDILNKNPEVLEAISLLGLCYQQGFGVKKDLVGAFKLLENAAVRGNASAQLYLAVHYKQMYYQGKNTSEVEKSQYLTSIIKWFTAAAEQGDARAQVYLGVCYEDGMGVVMKDKKRALELYNQAAEQGYATAQNILGFCYKTGTGVPLNFKKAATYFAKAAEQGHSDAQNSLGECYRDGVGVQCDADYAARLFLSALEQENNDAYHNLSKLFNIKTRYIQCQNFDRYIKLFREKLGISCELTQNASQNVPEHNTPDNAFSSVNKLEDTTKQLLGYTATAPKTQNVAVTSSELKIKKEITSQNEFVGITFHEDTEKAVEIQTGPALSLEQKVQIEKLTTVAEDFAEIDRIVKSHEAILKELNHKSLKVIQGNEALLNAALEREFHSQLAETQRMHIIRDERLNDYYHCFLKCFNSKLDGYHVIYSNLVRNGKITKTDAALLVARKVAKSVPIVGSGVELITDVVQLYTDREKAIEVNRIVEFFPIILEQFNQLLARHLTLLQQTAICSKERAFGKTRQLANKVFVDDIDNPIKLMASEDCNKILERIMSGKLKQSNEALLDINLNVQQLVKIIVPNLEYDLKKTLENLTKPNAIHTSTFNCSTSSFTLSSSSSTCNLSSSSSSVDISDRTKQELVDLRENFKHVQAKLAEEQEKNEAERKRNEELQRSVDAQSRALQDLSKKFEAMLSLSAQGNGNQAQGLMLPNFVNAETETNHDKSIAHLDTRLKHVEITVLLDQSNARDAGVSLNPTNKKKNDNKKKRCIIM